MKKLSIVLLLIMAASASALVTAEFFSGKLKNTKAITALELSIPASSPGFEILDTRIEFWKAKGGDVEITFCTLGMSGMSVIPLVDGGTFQVFPNDNFGGIDSSEGCFIWYTTVDRGWHEIHMVVGNTGLNPIIGGRTTRIRYNKRF